MLMPAFHSVKPRVSHSRLDTALQGEDGDTIFEYLVREDTAGWQHWRECVPTWTYPKGEERPKFSQLVIPTLDSVRYEKLLGLVYSVNKVSICQIHAANACVLSCRHQADQWTRL